MTTRWASRFPVSFSVIRHLLRAERSGGCGASASPVLRVSFLDRHSQRQFITQPGGVQYYSTEGSREGLTFEMASLKRAVDLTGLPQPEIREIRQNIDAVMFDCDGVLWLGNEPFENAQKLVIMLRMIGKKVFFLTNNSTKTRAEFLEKFNSLGFETTEEEIISTAYLTALYLQKIGFQKKAYVVGSKGITQELADVGIECVPVGPDPVPITSETWRDKDFANVNLDPEVGAVIVGFDHHFSYIKALKAASYLNENGYWGKERLFIATNTDEQFPGRGAQRKLVFPGTGTFVSAVKTCSGREPTIMGKPETFPFELIQKQYNLKPSRVLMVGDRGNTDILFGKKCGLKTLLVLSGVTSLAQMHGWEESEKHEEQLFVPDYYAKDVNDFCQHFLKHK